MAAVSPVRVKVAPPPVERKVAVPPVVKLSVLMVRFPPLASIDTAAVLRSTLSPSEEPSTEVIVIPAAEILAFISISFPSNMSAPVFVEAPIAELRTKSAVPVSIERVCPPAELPSTVSARVNA